MNGQQVDFSQLKLKAFTMPCWGATLTGPGYTLTLNAPPTWMESSGDSFRITEPETGTMFEVTAAFAQPDINLNRWAESRFGWVTEQMPYLKIIKDPYNLTGHHISGIAAEYQGAMPNSEKASHCLVLCLLKKGMMFSVMVTAAKETFAAHEKFYRWLLAAQLNVRTATMLDLMQELCGAEEPEPGGALPGQ